MAYVIYNLATTRLHSFRYKDTYATERAAKAAFTRFTKRLKDFKPEEWQIQEKSVYKLLIEETVERVNLMSGEKYRESVNTPNCCSPASETYWSM